MEKEISNIGTVSFIEERLPRDIRREWSKKVNKYGSTVNEGQISCLDAFFARATNDN